MSLEIISGTANYGLAQAVATTLGIELTPRTIERFPDGELNIEIQQSVRGCDVYLIQPTSPPVDEHLFELFLLADACRRAGATHLTAVIPYFGYARQDRRAHGREPVSARLVADLIGFNRQLLEITLEKVRELELKLGRLERSEVKIEPSRPTRTRIDA